MASASSRDAITEAVTPVLVPLGLVLEEVHVTAAGKRSVVRITIDKADVDAGLVTLDDIAEASKAISEQLDEVASLGESAYVLEVSSPGTDRPLTLPRHWQRNRGRLVTATLHDGSTVAGRISAADEHGVQLDDAEPLAWDQLVKGRIEVEFTHGVGDN